MNKNYDYTADGTLNYYELKGLISRVMFDTEEVPENASIYLLRKKRHQWLLESIETVDENVLMNIEYDRSDVPKAAFVCFATELDSDRIEFDDADSEIYIDWDAEDSMQDIINYTRDYIGDLDE